VDVDFAFALGALNKGPVHRFRVAISKGAVADKFAVQAAVVAEVDFFGHQAIENWADASAGLIDLDGELAILSKGRGGDKQTGRGENDRGGVLHEWRFLGRQIKYGGR